MLSRPAFVSPVDYARLRWTKLLLHAVAERIALFCRLRTRVEHTCGLVEPGRTLCGFRGCFVTAGLPITLPSGHQVYQRHFCGLGITVLPPAGAFFRPSTCAKFRCNMGGVLPCPLARPVCACKFPIAGLRRGQLLLHTELFSVRDEVTHQQPVGAVLHSHCDGDNRCCRK